MSALDAEQTQWVMRRMALWVDTRAASGYGAKHPVSNAEILHSALLYRLLRGLDPLPDPPPLRMSYPDYPAAEYPEPTWVSRD